MLLTDKIPDHVYESLKREGVDTEKIMMATYADMNRDHVFCDTYIVATEESLYVISGTVQIDGADPSGKQISRVWNETLFEIYSVSDIKSLKLEEMQSSARLTAKLESGDYSFLTAMTNTCRSSVLIFIKYFERMKKGELGGVDFEIDDDDKPESRCCPKCGMRYPDKDRKVCPKCMEKGQLYRRFGMFLVKYKGYIAVMLLSLLLLTGASILIPYFSTFTLRILQV